MFCRLFCGQCERPLCVQCAETYEHSSHAVVALTMALHKYAQGIKSTTGLLRAYAEDDDDDRSSRFDAQVVADGDGGQPERKSAFAPLIAHFDAQPQRFAASLRRAITADDVRRVLHRQVVTHAHPRWPLNHMGPLLRSASTQLQSPSPEE